MLHDLCCPQTVLITHPIKLMKLIAIQNVEGFDITGVLS